MVFMRKRKIASACSATCDVLVGVPGLFVGLFKEIDVCLGFYTYTDFQWFTNPKQQLQ
jgi:hypothetical protein